MAFVNNLSNTLMKTTQIDSPGVLEARRSPQQGSSFISSLPKGSRLLIRKVLFETAEAGFGVSTVDLSHVTGSSAIAAAALVPLIVTVCRYFPIL